MITTTSSLIGQLLNEIERLEKDSELLGDLLSVIHKDSHWQEMYGSKQATEDAMNIVLRMFDDLEEDE